MSKLYYVNDEINLDYLIKQKTKIIINFWAKWCGPCKFINNILEEISNEENIEIYSIDIDQFPNSIEKFSIKNIPCIQIYRFGKLIDTIQNVTLKEDIKEKL